MRYLLYVILSIVFLFSSSIGLNATDRYYAQKGKAKYEDKDKNGIDDSRQNKKHYYYKHKYRYQKKNDNDKNKKKKKKNSYYKDDVKRKNGNTEKDNH